MSEVREWLERLGLGEYVDVFERERVTLDDLPELNDEELKELGLPLGPRKTILRVARVPRGDQDLPNPAGVELPRSTPAAIEPQAERRQLTVMFCDMVGFTELASRVDPEVLQQIIRVYEDTCAAAITRYDGYVFQRLGDGIVAFFGYPLAHEGEAERAIRAGLDIIDAFAGLDVPDAGSLQVRIGIATGLVVVSSAEKGAVGETMNLASRLQGIARVNTIVVSERVHRLASGTFDYEDLGQQKLKGIAQPTRAYRIAGVSEAASRFEAAAGEHLTPLVGRELELGLLMDRWALAQDGEGQVVLLSGEPGIGKSRVLSALRDKLEGEGANAMRFQCSPYYVNSAFWPSIDNFERALKFTRDESPDSKLDKLEALIVGHYQRPLVDVRFIATMLSIPCDARYGELALTPQKFKNETLRSLVDLTEAAANRQPSVLMFEDAHWADPTTLEVLDLLIDRVKAMPLLIALTHRPEFQNRWVDHGHVTGLNLSKLTRAQSGAMVARVAEGKVLPPGLLEQIIARTDGVPLFVEELTKSILESGELKQEADRYNYTGTSHYVTVPATLRDSLMARLDRYAPVKEIAQIGAAIGRDFSYELVSAVAPLSKTQLEDALTQLVDSGLAFRRGTPPDAVYTFKHALVQDAAYDSLLKSRRQELHARIAKVIDEHFPQTRDAEPEVLAHHLTAAGAMEAAIPLWQKAGELALKRMAHTEAISHLNKGIELIDALPASAERDACELALRVPLGTAWVARKNWSAFEVWDSLYPALALAKSLGRNDLLTPILEYLHGNVIGLGRAAESAQWAQEMLDMAKATGDDKLLVAGHAKLVQSYGWMGNLVEAAGQAEKALALYEKKGRRVESGSGAGTSGWVSVRLYESILTWMLGYPDRAVQYFDEGIAQARRSGHPFDLGWALSFGADVFDFRCEPDKLRKHNEESERLGRENSLAILWAAMVPIRYGIALIREGKAAEGIRPMKAVLTEGKKSPDSYKLHSPYLKSVIAEGMAMTGDLDNALNLIEEQIEQVERPGWGERGHYAEILRLKGWMLMLKNDFEGAEKNYLASLDWAREQQAKSWELRTSTSLARLWQNQGKHKEARELLAPVYNWFTEGFDTKDLKEAKALLEELAA